VQVEYIGGLKIMKKGREYYFYKEIKVNDKVNRCSRLEGKI